MIIKCIGVSTTANSFGLHNHVFLGINGKFYEGLRTGQFKLQVGDTYSFTGVDPVSWLCRSSYECVREVPAVKDTAPLVAEKFSVQELLDYTKERVLAQLVHCTRSQYGSVVLDLPHENGKLIESQSENGISVAQWVDSEGLLVAQSTYRKGVPTQYYIRKEE